MDHPSRNAVAAKAPALIPSVPLRAEPEAAERAAAALREAVAERRWLRAMEIAERRWPLLISTEVGALRAFVDALPTSVLERYPIWETLRQYVRFLTMSPTIRPALFPDVAPEPGPHADLLELLVTFTSRAASARSLGRADESVEWARRARATYRSAEPGARQRARSGLATAWFEYAQCLEFALELDDAIESYVEAYGFAIDTGNARVAINAAGELAFLLAVIGDDREAGRWLALATALAREHRNVQGAMLSSMLARAVLRGDSAQPEPDQDELLALDAELAGEHAILVAASQVSRIGTETAAFSVFAMRIAAVPGELATLPLNGHALALARARLLVAHGQHEAALLALEHAISAVQGAATGDAIVRARAASVRLLLGDLTGALRAAERVVQGSHWPRALAEARLVCAAVHARRDETEHCARALDAALDSLDRFGPLDACAALSMTDLRALAAAAGDDERARMLETMVVKSAPLSARQDSLAEPLSPREAAVLATLGEGLSAKAAATALGVSQNTVKSQIRSIHRKLAVRDRTALVVEARRRGLL